MKFSVKLIGLIFSSIILGACAYTPQQATIAPDIQVVESNIGQGTTVALKVIDERPDQNIGHRGAAFVKGAEITTNQDIPGVIFDEIVKGLKAKGFNPVPFSEDKEISLKIELRLLEYSTSTGFWTGGVHTKAAMKAFGNNKGESYENFYRIDNEERVVFVPGAEHNEKLINQMISDVLQKLFQDQNLMAFLVKK